MAEETKAVIAQIVREPDGPLAPHQAVPTAIMFLVAALGGFVHFYRKWKDGETRAFNFTELIGELVVSGVCGVFALWVFKGFGLNEYLTAAGVGVVGHMGSRALFIAEKVIEAHINRWTPPK